MAQGEREYQYYALPTFLQFLRNEIDLFISLWVLVSFFFGVWFIYLHTGPGVDNAHQAANAAHESIGFVIDPFIVILGMFWAHGVFTALVWTVYYTKKINVVGVYCEKERRSRVNACVTHELML